MQDPSLPPPLAGLRAPFPPSAPGASALRLPMTSVRRARDQVEAGFPAGRRPDRRNRRRSHPAAARLPRPGRDRRGRRGTDARGSAPSPGGGWPRGSPFITRSIETRLGPKGLRAGVLRLCAPLTGVGALAGTRAHLLSGLPPRFHPPQVTAHPPPPATAATVHPQSQPPGARDFRPIPPLPAHLQPGSFPSPPLAGILSSSSAKYLFPPQAPLKPGILAPTSSPPPRHTARRKPRSPPLHSPLQTRGHFPSTPRSTQVWDLRSPRHHTPPTPPPPPATPGGRKPEMPFQALAHSKLGNPSPLPAPFPASLGSLPTRSPSQARDTPDPACPPRGCSPGPVPQTWRWGAGYYHALHTPELKGRQDPTKGCPSSWPHVALCTSPRARLGAAAGHPGLPANSRA